MITWLAISSAILLIIARNIQDYQNDPYCNWCHSRHRGRCMFNPRSGRILANVNDGYFDYNDPNK